MRWGRLERSTNVEDRRRAGPVAAGVGGLGLIGVIVALFAVFIGGGGADLEGLVHDRMRDGRPQRLQHVRKGRRPAAPADP